MLFDTGTTSSASVRWLSPYKDIFSVILEIRL